MRLRKSSGTAAQGPDVARWFVEADETLAGDAIHETDEEAGVRIVIGPFFSRRLDPRVGCRMRRAVPGRRFALDEGARCAVLGPPLSLSSSLSSSLPLKLPLKLKLKLKLMLCCAVLR